MSEGNHLPGQWHEFKLWLRRHWPILALLAGLALLLVGVLP